MITISSPMKQEFIIELLDGKTYDDITFKYEGKSGMNMRFAVDPEDHDAAVAAAKKAIKGTEIGAVLYFQVK